jgi:hypothetical protein
MHSHAVKSSVRQRAARGGALALVAAAGMALAALVPGQARAGDDDSDAWWNFDKRIMDSVMHSLGLKNGTESDIEYRERSPLVVPPSRDLPPPQSSATTRAPNWPADADVQRRQAAKAKKKVDSTYPEDVTFGRSLRPSELNKGNGQVANSGSGDGGVANGTSDMENNVKPSRLGYKGGLFSSLFSSGGDNDVGTFTSEPPRTNLTEPPPGYQTPSPNQPYGTTKRVDWGKAKKAEDIPVGDVFGGGAH